MKKRILLFAIALAAVLTGFSVYKSSTDLKMMLVKSWEDHNEADEAYMAKFASIVSALGEHSPQIRAKLDSYKERLEISDDNQLFQLVFLLRRNVDQGSFYNTLDHWDTLSEDAKNIIIDHLGPTYEAMTGATVKANHELVALLGERHEKGVDAVIEQLPEAFQTLTNKLSAEERHNYVNTLESLMVNTLKVMAFLGHKDPEPGSDPKTEL